MKKNIKSIHRWLYQKSIFQYILPARIVCFSFKGGRVGPKVLLWSISWRCKMPRREPSKVFLHSSPCASIRDKSIILGAAIIPFPPRGLQLPIWVCPEQFLLIGLESNKTKVILPSLTKLAVTAKLKTFS